MRGELEWRSVRQRKLRQVVKVSQVAARGTHTKFQLPEIERLLDGTLRVDPDLAGAHRELEGIGWFIGIEMTSGPPPMRSSKGSR
jgi:hypothetical protein